MTGMIMCGLVKIWTHGHVLKMKLKDVIVQAAHVKLKQMMEINQVVIQNFES